MARAIKLNLNGTHEVFDLGPYPHLHDVLEAHFDIAFLNGPVSMHPRHVTVGIAVDDTGLLKKLPKNHIATSLNGCFRYQDTPLVGPAVITASDFEGELTDVPDWALDLVVAIQAAVNEAFKYIQRSGNN